MAFIPVVDCWEIRVVQTLVSAPQQVNVYHVDATGHQPLTQAKADALAEAIENAYETSTLNSVLATVWSLDHIVVTDLTTSSAPQFSGVFDALAGTDVSEILPPFVAGSIEWGTGLRGRSFRGRTYHGGFCEDSSNTGPTAAFLTKFDLFASVLLSNVNALTAGLSVVSRFTGTHLVNLPDGQIVKRPSPRAAGLVTHITSGEAETVWNTQKRRNTVG